MAKFTSQGFEQSITPKFPKNSSFSSLRTEPESMTLKQRAFHKIKEDQKFTLMQLITLQNYSMKKAAKQAKMSYSTAKKIVNKFRQAVRVKFPTTSAVQDENKLCHYREIQPQQYNLTIPIPIITTIASRHQILSKNIVSIQKIDC